MDMLRAKYSGRRASARAQQPIMRAEAMQLVCFIFGAQIANLGQCSRGTGRGRASAASPSSAPRLV
jgi:hypothetical protein